MATNKKITESESDGDIIDSRLSIKIYDLCENIHKKIAEKIVEGLLQDIETYKAAAMSWNAIYNDGVAGWDNGGYDVDKFDHILGIKPASNKPSIIKPTTHSNIEKPQIQTRPSVEKPIRQTPQVNKPMIDSIFKS